jgi:hypothetical protein
MLRAVEARFGAMASAAPSEVALPRTKGGRVLLIARVYTRESSLAHAVGRVSWARQSV